jgi:hypothetical protein
MALLLAFLVGRFSVMMGDLIKIPFQQQHQQQQHQQQQQAAYYYDNRYPQDVPPHIFEQQHKQQPRPSSGGGGVDLLPHLEDCDKPQSSMSLQQLATKYRPSKFVRYAHTNFDRTYPDYLEKYRTKKFRMLEIGLDTGNGTLLWQEYFPCADLYGLEYDVRNSQTDGALRITTVQGDQGNATFLETDFLRQTDGGNFDVIVDDGGHHYEQQVTSYRVLFDRALNPGGLYLLEDIETSYWKPGIVLYNQSITRGGHADPNTLINKFKSLVDVGAFFFGVFLGFSFVDTRHVSHSFSVVFSLVIIFFFLWYSE